MTSFSGATTKTIAGIILRTTLAQVDDPNKPEAEPFRIPAVEVDEVSGLDAAGAGEPTAGGTAQRAALHRHVQTLGVVHRLHHGTARTGRTRMRMVGAVGRAAGRVRTA